ncbi:hypothetical protein KR018_011800 [Drosophila ironensis]|nr:hypothetical protein KR018_011800 [Drosophila ironensis]
MGSINNCTIKAIDRKHNMINLAAFVNFSIHFKILKRESGGWHPFMYDISVDICKFFVNRRAFFIPNLIYSFIKPFTNVNHTCPYPGGSELRLWNWTPDEDGVIAKFPVDHGQYGMHTIWYVNKVMALTINGSVLFYK